MSPTFGRRRVTRRRRVTLATMVVAAFVVPVAIAYACNPQAHVALDKTSYQPGGAITVHGSYFVGNSAVTVSGPTGSVGVTTSPGGAFTATLSAPTSPGSYTITASRPTGGFAAASFSVAAPAPAAKPNTPAVSAPAESAKSTPGFKTPGVSKSQAPASAEQSNPPSSGGGGNTSSGGGGVPGSTVTSSTTGQQVFSGATVQATTGRSFSTTPAGAVRSSRTAPATSAAADLFSNYQPGLTPSLTGAAAGAPAGGAGSGLGLGVGLLAFGLLALVAGLTATEVRRRRPA